MKKRGYHILLLHAYYYLFLAKILIVYAINFEKKNCGVTFTYSTAHLSENQLFSGLRLCRNICNNE